MINDLPTIYHYTGDGSQVDFAYPAPIPTADDLYVAVDGVEAVNYSVDLATADSKPSDAANPVVSATVTFTDPPAIGAVVSVRSTIALEQTTDYDPFQKFPADLHEQAMDRLYLAMQQLRDAMAYAVTVNLDLPLPDYPTILPPWESGKLLAWSGVTEGEIINADPQDFPVVGTIVAGGTYYLDSGTANNYVLTPGVGTDAPTGYYVGMVVEFLATNANTGASVVDVAGLGNKDIKWFPVTGSPLAANDIRKGTTSLGGGELVRLMYNGTYFFPINGGRMNLGTRAQLFFGDAGHISGSGKVEFGTTQMVFHFFADDVFAILHIDAAIQETWSISYSAYGFEHIMYGTAGGSTKVLQYGKEDGMIRTCDLVTGLGTDIFGWDTDGMYAVLPSRAALFTTRAALAAAVPSPVAASLAYVADDVQGLRVYNGAEWIDPVGIGWKGLVSEIVVRGGVSSPAFTLFRDALYAYEFTTALKEIYLFFHIGHDYKMGSTVYPHIHFAVGNSALSGNVKWGFEYSVAKGHQQGAGSVYGASATVYATVAVGVNSNYEHHVAEVTAGITDANFEPDSTLMLRVFRDNTVGSNLAVSVWGTTANLHYQYDRSGTLNKKPDFYA